jgi:CBS domain-containing protein
MLVRELMSQPAHTVRTQDSLATAARLLWDHDCGILPVVDREGCLGATITDRDICMAAYTRGRPLAELQVADSMSKTVVTCRADEELDDAARRMIAHQIRRLPVVDAGGRPCGVLSLNDLALAAERNPVLGQKVLQVLGAVCRHRTAVPAERPASARPATATAEARAAAGRS